MKPKKTDLLWRVTYPGGASCYFFSKEAALNEAYISGGWITAPLWRIE